jgi:hypothetical protein
LRRRRHHYHITLYSVTSSKYPLLGTLERFGGNTISEATQHEKLRSPKKDFFFILAVLNFAGGLFLWWGVVIQDDT